MPIYCYTCSKGHTSDVFFHPTEERPDTLICERKNCDSPAKRDLKAENATSMPRIAEGGWYSMTLGKRVESRKEFDRECKRKGIVITGDA